MIILNCGITMQDSEVLKPCVMDKNSDEFKRTGEFHTGLDIVAENTNSVYRGRVVYIGNEDSGRTVVIQTGSSFCVCYKRLKTVNVTLNDLIEERCFIGIADKYVHVEVYLKDKSDWPVRIGYETWYKADANLLIQGGLQSLADCAYQQNYTDFNEFVTETVMNNLTDNEEV